VLLGEHAQELVLRRVGVLELVHQDVAEAGRVTLRDVRMFAEQLDHRTIQVAEVDRAGGLQGALVALVHPLRDAARHVVVGGFHLARRQAGVFSSDRCARRAGGRCLRPPPGPGTTASLGELVGVVVDSRTPG